MKRALDIIHLVLHSMKKTINSLEKGLISALLILTFSCSRELDSPPPGGLMSASNTISEYEMLNTSRIWFEENYQSPCYVVSWANAKVHTSDTAYCAEARITGTFGMKYLSPEKTGLDANMPHLVVKSVENERQARIMYISPDAGNTQDVRLMNYSNVGIFTGKIYYFDPDEKLSHIILFHNGQADTYFAPVASGNASGGELLMDDEITEDEYNDLPDDIKTLYWYDRKSGKYTLNHFDEVKITPQPSGGDDSGKKTNLEEYPRPKDDAFPRKDGGGSSGGGSGNGNQPAKNRPPLKVNEKVTDGILDDIRNNFTDEENKIVDSLINNGIFTAEKTDTVKTAQIKITNPKDPSRRKYELQINKYIAENLNAKIIKGLLVHEFGHLFSNERGEFGSDTEGLEDYQHRMMIEGKYFPDFFKRMFPNQSPDFYQYGPYNGTPGSPVFEDLNENTKNDINEYLERVKLKPIYN